VVYSVVIGHRTDLAGPDHPEFHVVAATRNVRGSKE
jgi:hypothetical protein